MTNLSPTAQAVLDAFLTQWDVYAVDDARHAMAAALRAAADQAEKQLDSIAYIYENYSDGMWDTLACIESIAAELEGAQ